jgi:hypothetical protein
LVTFLILLQWCQRHLQIVNNGALSPTRWRYQSKYKLLGFLTPNRKNSKRKALAFNRDRCCHLALCLRLILFQCWDTNISFYLETSGGQSYNIYLDVVLFSTPVSIRHLWPLETVVFLHCCLICTVPLFGYKQFLLLRDTWWSKS